jgi:hypothetical protein
MSYVEPPTEPDYVRMGMENSKAPVGVEVPEEAKIEQAITDARRMRKTHEEWLRHVTPGPDGKTERCPECAEGNVAEVVGDADHHKGCIAAYDNIIDALEGRINA